MIRKAAVVTPAATGSGAGTATTFTLLLNNDTTAPLAGPGVPSVTVPVLPLPPVRTEGFSVIIDRTGFTTSEAVLETPLNVAVIPTIWPEVTFLLVATNVAVVAPAPTVTEAGTVAVFVFALASVTTA